MTKDDGIRIEWSENSVVGFLDMLDEVFPLRWRELRISHETPCQSYIHIHVCVKGHVHLLLDPRLGLHGASLATLYGFTLARILDTRKKLPRYPSLKVVQRTIGEIHHAVICANSLMGLEYERHIKTLHQWLDLYAKEAGKPPYFEKLLPRRPARRRRARVAVGEPQVAQLGLGEQPSTQDRSEPRQAHPISDPPDDLGASIVMSTPTGIVMFGILNAPCDLGEC